MQFHCGETQKNENRQIVSRNEVLARFAEQKGSLYWTALMITGKAELAAQSIVDAGGLAPESNSYGFRGWLNEWGHLATARAAVNAVRLSIQATAAQYADCTCSHRTHKPLSPVDARTLHELEVYEVIQHLDILARAVLVLYGCQRMSLSDSAFLLKVPFQCVVSAYCRALQWYREFVKPVHEVRHADVTTLHLVRHDADGVPVWG
jgi:DNA-directed RNA polymerase specialized sigma24 family protein